MIRLLLGHATAASSTASSEPIPTAALRVDCAGRGGWTPLGLAARSGDVPAVKALLEGGADPAAVMPTVGKTPLEIARINKRVAVVKLLGGED